MVRGMRKSQLPFLNAVFAVIEEITRAELTATSRRLIISYMNESPQSPLVERARSAITRYTQKEMPTLEDLRARSAGQRLQPEERALLRVGEEASRLER